MKCLFCEKSCKSYRSLIHHSIRCKFNPDRVLVRNQHLAGTAKPMSEETRQKISEAASRPWTEERKINHRTAMRKAVLNYPESYSSSNRGRVKQIEHDGLKFQGKWELDFYTWCKQNQINVSRPIESFEYIYENRTRQYFPDFFLSDFNLYVEVKGYETERDRAKWISFPHKLKIIKGKEIYQIRSNKFNLSNLIDNITLMY